MKSSKFAAAAAAAGLSLACVVALADGGKGREGPGRFEVTITNLTRTQSFTPILAAAHTRRVAFFELGQPAGEGLALLAESGDTSLLASELASTGQVGPSVATNGLLAPGQSVTLKVTASPRFDQLSLAAMLIPTNDSFVALDSLDLPWDRAVKVRLVPAYDSGSEPNDELCSNIPGPVCGGAGGSPGVGGEGYVHVSAGIHGIGDLAPSRYDWRNPVAKVVVRRVN
jgi:hypothetical protein